MLDPKQVWTVVFGLAFLILPVVPTVAQIDAPAICLSGCLF